MNLNYSYSGVLIAVFIGFDFDYSKFSSSNNFRKFGI